jgi:alpha-tubulin suppressor-like RCC1 family protein
MMLSAMMSGQAWRQAHSAFSGKTTHPANSFSAAANFETGRVYSWGDDFSFRHTPAQVDAATTWNVPATGEDFACASRTDGTLWCWGRNFAGRLGVGDAANRTAPTRVGVATTWSSVAAGLTHACALRTDSTLWCWGNNGGGQLGTGNTTSQDAPVQVTSPASTGWTSVTAGARFTCATRTGGVLYCWGENGAGQVGINSAVNQSTPAQVSVPSTTGWSSVKAGFQHACALRSATLYCWGDGGGGRLGLGTVANHSTPQQVAGTTWSQLSLGGDHSCAIKSDGTLWCWGAGGNGRLGIGTTAEALSPAQVGSATTWRSAAGGRAHTCAARTDNTLWCWGDNAFGTLGLGDLVERLNPVQVTSGTPWSTQAQGSVGEQTCTTRSDGTLWCWGDVGAMNVTPVQLDAATTWSVPAAGGEFGCGIRTDGSLWCWGRNGSGRLGVGDTGHRVVPTRVGVATTWSSVTAGMAHACGLRTDGTLWCWGENGAGQLGVGGGASSQNAPVQVTAPASTGWTSVTAGTRFTCATRTGGALYCWGENNIGQLGINSTINQNAPAQVGVPSATGWSSVRAGWQHACALRSATLYCWGDGGNGRLGLGTAANHSTPQQVPGTTWSQLSLGADHTCAIKSDGTLWCWGTGGEGRLGNGSTVEASSPTQVGSATTWRTVTGGRMHTCGTQTGPTVWCWGNNEYGQLGLGDTTARLTPTQIPGVPGRPITSGPASSVTLLVRG